MRKEQLRLLEMLEQYGFRFMYGQTHERGRLHTKESHEGGGINVLWDRDLSHFHVSLRCPIYQEWYVSLVFTSNGFEYCSFKFQCGCEVRTSVHSTQGHIEAWQASVSKPVRENASNNVLWKVEYISHPRFVESAKICCERRWRLFENKSSK
jgi:hypothetical protein